MAICIRLHQEQIALAVELGLGAQGPEEIEILTDDEEGEVFAEQMLRSWLHKSKEQVELPSQAFHAGDRPTAYWFAEPGNGVRRRE